LCGSPIFIKLPRETVENGMFARNSHGRVNDMPHDFLPERQAELFIELNDLIVNNFVNIPLVRRTGVLGSTTRLQGVVPTPWDEFTYDIANWYMED
jgi:ABC-type transport system substrate-binding protein